MDEKSIAVWWSSCSLISGAGFFRNAIADAGASSMRWFSAKDSPTFVRCTAVPVATTVDVVRMERSANGYAGDVLKRKTISGRDHA